MAAFVPYTEVENAEILELRARGYTWKEISRRNGRDARAIAEHIRQLKIRNKREDGAIVRRENTELSPREMIKRLYDMGYRIENNQLVCYQKTVVKIQDIIREG